MTFNAEVDESASIDDIDRGDVIRVELKSIQTINSNRKLTTQHTITCVLSRIQAPELIPITAQKLSEDEAFRELRDFFEEKKREGIAKPPKYDLPPIDTIGKIYPKKSDHHTRLAQIFRYTCLKKNIE